MNAKAWFYSQSFHGGPLHDAAAIEAANEYFDNEQAKSNLRDHRDAVPKQESEEK